MKNLAAASFVVENIFYIPVVLTPSRPLVLFSGWTGVYCDHKFETCDNQEGHTCYHGGECIPGLEDKYGNDQLFCDCSKAVGPDGERYVGKYCEVPFEQICNNPDDDDEEEELLFCVNGGECNPEYP